MQQFMWQPKLQVAEFLDAGMNRLQTVELNVVCRQLTVGQLLASKGSLSAPEQLLI